MRHILIILSFLLSSPVIGDYPDSEPIKEKCAKTNIAKQRIVPVTPANVPKNNVATATRMLGEITGKFLVLPCNPILTYYT